MVPLPRFCRTARLLIRLLLVAPALSPGALADKRSGNDGTPGRGFARVGELASLRVVVPDHPSFVVAATLPIAPREFERFACPLKVLDPDGNPLPTQWDLVARTQDFLVVELRAAVRNNLWSGMQTFSVVEGQNEVSLMRFRVQPLALVALEDLLQVVVEDQQGGLHEYSLSGFGPQVEYTRFGSATVTGRHHVQTEYGSFQSWLTVNAYQRQVEMILNWNNGELPARPDVYFTSLSLMLPQGWTWTPLLPDPAMGEGYLVRPDEHVLPQRMERCFRIVLHPVTEVPDLQGGWGVGDWSRGGYLAQSFALPDLGHVSIDLGPQRDDDFTRLRDLMATFSGATPVSALWPAAGVLYGGMTGGFDIDQIPAVPLALSGQRAGLESLYVEQLRYGARQPGCIYDGEGRPIELEAYRNADGTIPWSHFNNRFLGNPPKDAPFGFHLTGPGNGFAAYDPLVFEPIDVQHYVRRTKANKALVWLANDPLARQYLLMDAELARMSIYEGPGSSFVVPATPGLGTTLGRSDAWAADAIATAYAVSDDAYRDRTRAWLQRFADILRAAQMPNGLFSAERFGKIAKDPPYGDGTTAQFWVHRSEEQVFLLFALRAVHATVGIDCADMIRRAGLGLWEFAWKEGTQGPLSRYPAGPIGGPRYATRSDIPPGLTDTVGADTYQVATSFGIVHEAGQQMLLPVLAHTRTSVLRDALGVFESWGLSNIQNRANTLKVLQDILGAP